jgi:uncharacterized membrane protein (UPF0127 family)
VYIYQAVRTITVIAIVAAAAAVIIASAVLFYSDPDSDGYGYIGSFDWETTTKAEQPVNEVPANGSYRQVNVTVNGIKLVADIAETSDQRIKGLSVKDTLGENEAMLFVFNESHEHSFWMKGMKFPIDIIWISQHNEVVHVEHSLEPCNPDSFCPSYKPDRDSLYVLETVAGFAQKYSVTENTYVNFQLDE